MKENKFQKQVIKQLENQAAFVMNFHGHGMQKSGWPDLEVLHRRWDGFLELKVGKNKASVLQRVIAAKIELRGTPVYVLRCVECIDITTIKELKELQMKIFEYTLENFEGKVIKTFYDLRELLDVLVELSEPELIPYCEYLHIGEKPTGDEKTCKEQCIPYTRNICRKKWRKNNEMGI